MTEVEKYNLDSGKTFNIAPTMKANWFRILTQSSLKAVRSVANTVVSMIFLRDGIRLKFFFLEMM